MMSTDWVAVEVGCPFYRQSDARQLHCEGVFPGTNMTTTFRSSRSRAQLMERLCKKIYTDCELYRQIVKKYGG